MLALTLAHRHGFGGAQSALSSSPLVTRSKMRRVVGTPGSGRRAGILGMTGVGRTASPSAMRAGVWSGGSYWLAIAKMLVDAGALWWGPSVSHAGVAAADRCYGASVSKENSGTASIPVPSSEETMTALTPPTILLHASDTAGGRSAGTPNIADYAPFRDRSWRTPLHLLMGVIPSLSVGNDGVRGSQVFQQHRMLLLLTRRAAAAAASAATALAVAGLPGHSRTRHHCCRCCRCCRCCCRCGARLRPWCCRGRAASKPWPRALPISKFSKKYGHFSGRQQL